MTISEIDIDFQTYGIEVISDACKFILPVPESREELIIRNYTDQSNQSVAVDGTGIIIFNFNSREEAELTAPKIQKLIQAQLGLQEQNENIDKIIDRLTVQHIRNIVDKAHTELGQKDIYPTNKNFVQNKLIQVNPACSATDFYGLYQRNITEYCKAVYIKGSGEFHGPTIQKFVGGAAIVQHSGSCRLVQTDVFLKTYKNKDHSKIQECELERNPILVSQLKKKLTHVEKLVLRRSSTQSRNK